MIRKAASGLDIFLWRAWASRVAPRDAVAPAAAVGSDGRRMTAEKRAAAAEIIAKEANAARLKALLDAAREQDAAETIRSAEARFAAARTEWESVRHGLGPEPDPYAEIDAPEPPAWAAPTPTAWLPKLTEVARSRGLSLGVLAMALLVGGIGGGAYLHSVGSPTIEEAQVAQPLPSARDAPAVPKEDALASAGPTEPVAAAPVKKARRPPIARVPRVWPGQEALAVGAPQPVEQPITTSNVE